MSDYMSSPHVSGIQKPNDKDLTEWVVVRDPLRDWTSCKSIVQFV